MKSKIKNWFWAVFFAVGAVLDYTIDLLPEALKYFHIEEKYVNIIRFSMFAFTLIKIKLEMPSQNPEKLEQKIQSKKQQ